MKPKEIFIKTAMSALAKAASAFAAFFMTILITRNMPASESGLILLTITILTIGAVFFRLGLDNIILRHVSANNNGIQSRSKLTTGLIWITSISVPTSAIIAIFSDEISYFVLSKPELGPILRAAIWSIPAMAAYMLIAKGFQACHRAITSIFFTNLGVSILFIFGFVIVHKFSPNTLSAKTSAVIFSFSSVLTLFISLVLWHKQCKGKWGKPKILDYELWTSSANLWIASITVLAVQWSSLLIAGAYLDSTEFAHLSAAQRTANLTSFILMVVNLVIAPRYAILWKNKNKVEMERLAKWSFRGMILLALPIVLLMFFFPKWIMSMFGDGYTNGSLLLTILALGQFVNVATGSVGYLLTMSGHEKDYRKVILFAGPLTILVSLILIVNYGSIGAAVSAATGLIIQNLGALWMVKKRLGFMPIG